MSNAMQKAIDQEEAAELSMLSTEEKAAMIGAEIGVEKTVQPEYEIIEDEDERLGKTRDGQTIEAPKTERKKLDSKQKRDLRRKRLEEKFQAKDAIIDVQQSEINEMRRTLEALQNKTVQYDRAHLEREYAEAKYAADLATEKRKRAFADGDAEADTRALTEWYSANERMKQLQGMASSNPQLQAAPVAQPKQDVGYNTRVQRKAQEWFRENPWFKQGSADTDSKVAEGIAAAIVQEGFDPESDDFYDELNDRIDKYIPHRANNADDEEDEDDVIPPKPVKRRSSPPTGGASARGDLGAKVRVNIPTAYIKALKENNLWDDVPTRQEMIKRYLDNKQNS